MIYGTDDCSSGHCSGEGGIGIVRVSGPESYEILKKIFRRPAGERMETMENRRLIYGNIVDSSGSVIDEAMVVYMKAPHTYTGEDVAEIQCHGSSISLRRILAEILRSGAVLAERGEFTKRAFLSGRIDLSQAEAVIDVIKAKSEAGFQSAVSQMGGSLSAQIQSVRTQLADLISNIIAHIEYPEEDLEELTYEKILEETAAISRRIEKLIASADTGRIVKDGLKLCIAGRPNVGKSSLMNALLKSDRATLQIFRELRGIPSKIRVDCGIPGTAVETAGIRETEDTIEKIGIEKSRESLTAADIVVFVLDGSAELSEEDREIMAHLSGKKVIFVINKSDLGIRVTSESIESILPEQIPSVNKDDGKEYRFLHLSALTGEGIEMLSEEIRRMVYNGEVTAESEILVTNVRHKDLLERSLRSLFDASEMLRAGKLSTLRRRISAAPGVFWEKLSEKP